MTTTTTKKKKKKKEKRRKRIKLVHFSFFPPSTYTWQNADGKIVMI